MARIRLKDAPSSSEPPMPDWAQGKIILKDGSVGFITELEELVSGDRWASKKVRATAVFQRAQSKPQVRLSFDDGFTDDGAKAALDAIKSAKGEFAKQLLAVREKAISDGTYDEPKQGFWVGTRFMSDAEAMRIIAIQQGRGN